MKRTRTSAPSEFAQAIGAEFEGAAREAVARARSAGVRIAGAKPSAAEKALMAPKKDGADVLVAPARRPARAKVGARKGA